MLPLAVVIKILIYLENLGEIMDTLLLMELTLIQKIAVWSLPILFAITLHEVAHGWVASLFGDQTARFSGRLSLNPLKHIDPIGTVLLPLLMMAVSNVIFGWAKPVPVDPRNLHHPQRDMVFVAIAGPFANFLMALFWAGIQKIGMLAVLHDNTWLGTPLAYMGSAGVMINIVLLALNLLPLPPLDGAKVLSGFLPRKMAYYFSQMEPYSFFILILLLFSGALFYVMGPIIVFFLDLINYWFGL